MLEEELIIGIKVLAKLHSGEIDFNCSNCSDYQKEQLNCNNPDSDKVVYSNDELGEFSCCPLKFVTKPIFEFYNEYQYYQIFTGTAPKYGEHNERFFEAIKIYKQEYDSSSAKMIKAPKKENSDDSLATLRTNFRKKKNKEGK